MPHSQNLPFAQGIRPYTSKSASIFSTKQYIEKKSENFLSLLIMKIPYIHSIGSYVLMRMRYRWFGEPDIRISAHFYGFTVLILLQEMNIIFYNYSQKFADFFQHFSIDPSFLHIFSRSYFSQGNWSYRLSIPPWDPQGKRSYLKSTSILFFINIYQ